MNLPNLTAEKIWCTKLNVCQPFGRTWKVRNILVYIFLYPPKNHIIGRVTELCRVFPLFWPYRTRCAVTPRSFPRALSRRFSGVALTDEQLYIPHGAPYICFPFFLYAPWRPHSLGRPPFSRRIGHFFCSFLPPLSKSNCFVTAFLKLSKFSVQSWLSFFFVFHNWCLVIWPTNHISSAWCAIPGRR